MYIPSWIQNKICSYS